MRQSPSTPRQVIAPRGNLMTSSRSGTLMGQSNDEPTSHHIPKARIMYTPPIAYICGTLANLVGGDLPQRCILKRAAPKPLTEFRCTQGASRLVNLQEKPPGLSLMSPARLARHWLEQQPSFLNSNSQL